MERINSTEGIIQLLKERNIDIHRADLGGQCHAMTRKWAEGYLVLVDESLCLPVMLDALKHELKHILLGHLDDDIKSVEQKESEVISI